LERCLGSAQQSTHLVWSDPECGRDFGVAEAAVAQRQYAGLLWSHPPKCGSDQTALLPGFQHFLRVDKLIPGAAHMIQLSMLSAPAAAKPGQADVRGGASEPGGGEAGIRRIPLMEADERFLSDVLSLLAVANRLVSNADDASVLGVEPALEGRLTAGPPPWPHPHPRDSCLVLHSERNRRRRHFCGRNATTVALPQAWVERVPHGVAEQAGRQHRQEDHHPREDDQPCRVVVILLGVAQHIPPAWR